MRRTPAWVCGLLLALAVAGCSEDKADPPAQDPEQVIAQAKQLLDDTSGVEVTLSTDDLPGGVNGIASAEGTAVHPASFEGTLGVSLAGQPVEVEVISTGGKTWAVLPFTTSFQRIDPADYGAPDPGQLISPDSGVSALLAGTTGLAAGDTVRGGADNREVLTEYTGTAPASLVTSIVPQATGDFAVTYAVNADGQLRTAEITGQFYPDVATNSYTVTFSEYDVDRQISAP